MRPSSFLLAAALAVAFSAPLANAKDLNPADYPLRVALLAHNSHSHYNGGWLDYVDGEGRADLFENGQPEAVDYSYRCEQRLVNSMGFETYMARWKKAGRELEVLLPETGHPGRLASCKLQVTIKEGMAYFRHNGVIAEGPASQLKQWMVKHDYDPEHGKNVPANVSQPKESAEATAKTPQPSN